MLIILYKLLGLKIDDQIKEEIREILDTDDESFDGENEEIEFVNEVLIEEEEIIRWNYSDLFLKYQTIIERIQEENSNFKKINFFNLIMTARFEDLITISLDISVHNSQIVQEFLLNLGLLQITKPVNMIEGQDKKQKYLIPFLFPTCREKPSFDKFFLSNGEKPEYIKKLNTKIFFFFPFQPPVTFL